MVYFLMMPFGLFGGSQDTTTLLAEEGTALMPAGGPGSKRAREKKFYLSARQSFCCMALHEIYKGFPTRTRKRALQGYSFNIFSLCVRNSIIM